MNQSYKAINLQYAVPPSLPSWGDLEGLSVDPLQFKYPHYTPYQYAGNKPISYIDLDGGEEKKSMFNSKQRKKHDQIVKENKEKSLKESKAEKYYDKYMKKTLMELYENNELDKIEAEATRLTELYQDEKWFQDYYDSKVLHGNKVNQKSLTGWYTEQYRAVSIDIKPKYKNFGPFERNIPFDAYNKMRIDTKIEVNSRDTINIDFSAFGEPNSLNIFIFDEKSGEYIILASTNAVSDMNENVYNYQFTVPEDLKGKLIIDVLSYLTYNTKDSFRLNVQVETPPSFDLKYKYEIIKSSPTKIE